MFVFSEILLKSKKITYNLDIKKIMKAFKAYWKVAGVFFTSYRKNFFMYRVVSH